MIDPGSFNRDNGFLLIGKIDNRLHCCANSVQCGDLVLAKIGGFTNNTGYYSVPDNWIPVSLRTANDVSLPGQCYNGSIEIIVATIVLPQSELQWQNVMVEMVRRGLPGSSKTNDNISLVAGSWQPWSGVMYTSNAGQEDVWLIKIDGFGETWYGKNLVAPKKIVPVSITASADNG